MRAAPFSASRRGAALRLVLLLPLAVVVLAARPAADALTSRLAPLYERLDARQVSPHLWLALAEDPHPEARRLAAHVLASVADPLHLKLLERYQRDLSPAVRVEAMIAAGRLGEAGVGIAGAGLRDGAAGVRQAAAWALAQGGPAGCTALLAQLPVERDPAVLETLVAELWRCPAPAWESAAAAFAQDPRPGLRRAAAAALARGAGHPALGRLAVDPEPVIRATALAGMVRGPDDGRWGGAVVAALDDPDWRVQVAACGVLASRPAPPLDAAPGRRLMGLAGSNRSHLRVAALRALGAHPEVGNTEQLLGWAASAAPWIAAEALDAAARRQPGLALPTVSAWLGADDAWRRRAAASAVARLAAGPARDALETRVLEAAEPAVRLAWLERLEAPPEGGLERLRAALAADPDPAVRSTILDLLTASGQAPGPDALLALAQSWRDDEMGDARASALRAALQQAGGSEARATVLERAAADADDGVAPRLVTLARRLGLEAGLPSRPPRHGALWYRELLAWAGSPHWLEVETVRGAFRVRLEAAAAPITAREVFELARAGFYDGLTFHRVVPNFVVQGGDPRGDGWGGPGFTLPDEPSVIPFDSWRVGIATSGPHTGGCQLFVTLLPADRLTGHYTNLGEVVAGREVLTRIEVGDRMLRVTVGQGEAGTRRGSAAGPAPATAPAAR